MGIINYEKYLTRFNNEINNLNKIKADIIEYGFAEKKQLHRINEMIRKYKSQIKRISGV